MDSKNIKQAIVTRIIKISNFWECIRFLVNRGSIFALVPTLQLHQNYGHKRKMTSIPILGEILGFATPFFVGVLI